MIFYLPNLSLVRKGKRGKDFIVRNFLFRIIPNMRYTSAPASLYSANRKRFAVQMQAGSLAVFTSNDILPTNADGTMPFMQNKDLLHLSGIDQEESILILFPEAFDPKHREILLIKETSDTIAIWEGAKLSKEQARQASDIATVLWNTEFENLFNNLMTQASSVYLNRNEHLRAKVAIETKEDRLSSWVRQHYPLHPVHRSAPIMHQIRSVKQAEEIVLMQKAADINKGAYDRILAMLKPGLMEYELEAEFIHEYISKGSRGFSYEPIIASGANACVLHYIDNDAPVKDGDLILFDVGCWYGNYASDVTRCFPANGMFSPRQKEVYNAVLRVQKAAMEMLRPGNQLHEYHREVGKLMEAELLGLKLIDKTDIKNQNPEWPAYKKYFMHGTSHYLGLDVHDVGLWTSKMEVGNAFTVEPGIYILEEGLGIRIEENIVIGADGNLNMTQAIPKEVEESEERMNSAR